MARQGKIAKLPFRLRKQVCERLHDGQLSPEILSWLNAQPEAIAVWQRDFEGVPCSPQNLSEWRLGGYKDYLRDREEIDNIKALTDFAMEVAQSAGADLADGATAIVCGQIVKSFQSIASEGQIPLDKAAKAVAALRMSGVAKGNLELSKDKHKLSEKRHDLDREKFERGVCEAVLKAAKLPEVQQILNSGKSKAVQLDLLHAQLFGKAPAA
jgi:hypothetical protein